jgi:hypothetical protein
MMFKIIYRNDGLLSIDYDDAEIIWLDIDPDYYGNEDYNLLCNSLKNISIIGVDEYYDL